MTDPDYGSEGSRVEVVSTAGWGKPKVEDVLRFASVARADPQIWAMCARLSEEGNKESASMMAEADNLMQQKFLTQYAIKGRLQPVGFSAAWGVLIALAGGKIHQGDAPEAINHIKNNPFVDAKGV